jgi:hypothetical protein
MPQIHGLNGHGEKLSTKQHALISALLTEPSLQQAVKVVGIADSTAYRWLKMASFENAYRAARTEVVRQAVARLQAASGKAVSTLVEVMGDKDAGAPARVTAAVKLLEFSLRSLEWAELERRIAALEASEEPQHGYRTGPLA